MFYSVNKNTTTTTIKQQAPVWGRGHAASSGILVLLCGALGIKQQAPVWGRGLQQALGFL